MKKILIFLLIIVCISHSNAQIGMKANGTAPISSAQLEVQSTTKAFYPPRMTTALRTTFPNPPQAGAVVYDTDLNGLFIYNGSTWTSSLVLPYSATQNLASHLFKVENTNTGNFTAIFGRTNSTGFGAGVKGISDNPNPTIDTYGVQGENYSNNQNGAGVFGFHSGLGKAIYGLAIDGTAGLFKSYNSFALKTDGKIRFGGSGIGTLADEKFIKSINADGDAEWSDLAPYSTIQNQAQDMFKVENSNTSGIYSSIIGITNSGSNSGTGVKGIAKNTSPTGATVGVFGLNNSTNSLGVGVYGSAGTGKAVWGNTVSGTGVQGVSLSNGIGGAFTSVSGYALITAEGNVGIGTQTPAAKMDIKGSSWLSHFYYGSEEDTYIRGGKNGSKVIINDVTGLGGVGIGTSPNINSDEKLDVFSRIRIRHATSTSGMWMNNSANSINASDGAFYGMLSDTQTGIFIGGTWRFVVNNLGNGYLNGNLIQTSDRRLKKDFSYLTNSLSDVYQLNGYHFKWIEKSRSEDLQTGLIAQEVQKIFPELVQTDEKGFLSVNYIGLIPHLIGAVKELKNENEGLKFKNKSAENRLDKIETLLLISVKR